MSPPGPDARASNAGRVTYRDIRWRRDESGVTAWFNAETRQWIRWYPGADAPPLPPPWAAEAAASTPPRLERARWRSPYRIVPVVLVVLVVVIGTYQATRSTADPVRSETRAADALVGRCLAQDGTSGGRPEYKPSPVSCELPVATVKVVSVLPGTPGAPHCRAGTTAVQLRYIGVRYPHVECVVPAPVSG